MSSHPAKRKRVAAYVRVSRIGGRSGDGYIAKPQQRDRLSTFGEALDLEIPADAWFEDEDYTGGNIERPAFQAALEAIEAKQYDGLIVARLDRFSRDVVDGVTCVDRILAAGGIFASATEHMEVREPVGRFVLISMFNNAELQLSMLKRSWSDAKIRAVARGVHIGPTPFGYQRVAKGGDKASVLVPHPEHGRVLTDLYDRAATNGYTWTDLAAWLDERAPKRAAWTVTDVKRILQMRVYLGEVRYRSRVEGVADLVNLQAHEPLVDPVTFDEVGRLLLPGQRKRAAPSAFLLSGMLRCAHCRRAMGGFTYGGSKGDTPVYRCPGARHCPGRPVITARLLENYIKSKVDEFVKAENEEIEITPDEDREGVRLDLEVDRLKVELGRYLEDTETRRIVDDDAIWQQGVVSRKAELQDALAAREAWLRARPARRAKARKPLKDWTDHDYRDYLGGSTQAVFIRKAPGRSSLVERVLIVRADEPTIATHHKGSRLGPFGPINWDDPHSDTWGAGLDASGK